jgi:hypothetical protein
MMYWASVLVPLWFALSTQAVSTPVGCRAIKGDSNWPTQDVWTKELPGVVPTARRLGNVSLTDYTFIAKNVFDVQAAVKFAVKYNTRLTITNSGSDFLGRSAFMYSFPGID